MLQSNRENSCAHSFVETPLSQQRQSQSLSCMGAVRVDLKRSFKSAFGVRVTKTLQVRISDREMEIRQAWVGFFRGQ